MSSLAILKGRFIRAYKEYKQQLDGFSCGGSLAEYINPTLAEKRLKSKEIYKKLRKEDNECPQISWLEDK